MSEDKMREAIRKGEQASEILNNDAYKEAIAALRQTYTDALFQSTPLEEAKREKLYLAYNLLGKIEQHLHSTVSNGSLSKLELANLLADEKRKKKA